MVGGHPVPATPSDARAQRHGITFPHSHSDSDIDQNGQPDGHIHRNLHSYPNALSLADAHADGDLYRHLYWDLDLNPEPDAHGEPLGDLDPIANSYRDGNKDLHVESNIHAGILRFCRRAHGSLGLPIHPGPLRRRICGRLRKQPPQVLP